MAQTQQPESQSEGEKRGTIGVTDADPADPPGNGRRGRPGPRGYSDADPADGAGRGRGTPSEEKRREPGGLPSARPEE